MTSSSLQEKRESRLMLRDLSADDYRMILREELAARCRHNRRYSLRAFARDLRLAPSRVSEILNGKQGLSREAAWRMATMLGLESQEAVRFCDLVESKHARSHRVRAAAKARLATAGLMKLGVATWESTESSVLEIAAAACRGA